MNERIAVKFGTPEPIKFREYDEKHPEIDLELAFRAAGSSTVSAYDDAVYCSSEEVVSKVREIALSSLSDYVRTWPEGKSLLWNTAKPELAKYIDDHLAECGITAETELSSFVLTQDSRELYDWAISEATRSKMFIDIIDGYRNIIVDDVSQVRKEKSLFDGFYMGKNPLAPSSDDRMADIDGATVMGIVPNGSPITVPKDKYCRQCGAKRESGAKFCTECGAKFD